MRYLILFVALGSLASPLLAGGAAMQLRQEARAYALSGAKLRILPVGASITWGYHSSSGNGYRLDLKNMLERYADVEYIGTQCSGNMTNGNSEGHPGFVISMMEAVTLPDLPLRPNVILLYVGTNDMVFDFAPDDAPAAMGSLVQHLYKACPDATIIVGNLFLDLDPKVQARIKAYNKALPPVIRALAATGVKTFIADFANALTASDLYCDGEHPIDVGYEKMANVFFGAIASAAIEGLLTAPMSPNATKTVTCRPTPATGNVCTLTPTSGRLDILSDLPGLAAIPLTTTTVGTSNSSSIKPTVTGNADPAQVGDRDVKIKHQST